MPRALRRTEAVETAGIVRPPGIAEIERATGERVGLQRKPGGIGQVRAGLHHNNHVCSADDGEPELVRPRIKVAVIKKDNRAITHGHGIEAGSRGACS